MRVFVYSKALVLAGSALFALPALSAPGARAIDESRPVARDGRIEIENVSGSIEVVGWDKSELHVSGTVAEDVEKVEIDTSGSVTSIRVILPNNSNHGSADLRIEVPHGSRVEVETVSADITVRDLSGMVEAESVSGNIKVGGAITEIEGESVSGDITVSSTATLSAGKFETVSGDLELSGALSASGRFRFESVSGDVVLDLTGGTGADLDVETFSGDIRGDVPSGLGRDRRNHESVEFSVGGGGAKVTVETFSGSVDVKAGGAEMRKKE